MQVGMEVISLEEKIVLSGIELPPVFVGEGVKFPPDAAAERQIGAGLSGQQGNVFETVV